MNNYLLLLAFAAALLTGCQVSAPAPPTQTLPALTASVTQPLPSPSAAPTRTTLPTTTTTPTRTLTPTITPTLEPTGCLQPGEDYTLVRLNERLLNQRTASMLAHAAELYSGEIDILGYALTQGSYTDQVAASFGTHAGGGALDLSVMRQGTYTVLYDEIDPLISALRLAGFAAWLRDLDELYPGSPIHIHAVAIGDAHLSGPAREQLTGDYGYFRGYTGVPQPGGVPLPDRHGGPVLCQWMLEMGYADLRPPAP